MTGPNKREISEIERRIGDLEEPLLGDDVTLEDFPEILMQNLREHYGHGGPE